MSISKYVGLIVIYCLIFWSAVAVMKAVRPPSGPVQTASVAMQDEAVPPAVAIDESFFQPVVPVVEQTMPEKPMKLLADQVAAEAYIVGDISSGRIYLEKSADTVFPFASMTKLVTAITATNMHKPDDLIEVSQKDIEVSSDTAGLIAGEKFTVNELLYPLLLESSNVAAEALASAPDRRHFLELMSSYGWEIGMPKSFFEDPTGLSHYNGGTARGFFAMARYLYSDRQDILSITRTPHIFIATTTDHGSHDLTNIHPFVNDQRFLGGKTGHTPMALDTMLTIMKLGGRPIAIIVLRSPYERARDTRLLIDKVSALLTDAH
ncbi:MAG: serine hydrolase [Candidatus Paceibacterota bacterium]